MFSSDPPEDARVRDFYEDARAGDGYVNLAHVWAWRLEVCDAFNRTRNVLRE
ncbi:hypothetical protein WPS_00970 [Vulcanimicrobium alpinum]|uniref:Uncharacterized protein n=1 Tax=Vulcanimicrobium alpinum TaxID=3016050 RepID=A0AAN1XUT4_UNVUL|nr:hypothetical protein [Vulcanimicrobium alpinum]BDE04821.1 hypothetical protein WPS_00970 [Vulcanimicrobium alpinum]